MRTLRGKPDGSGATGSVYPWPWLLPSTVAVELDPPQPDGAVRRPRRTARDWAVDLAAFLVAVALGLVAVAALEEDIDYLSEGQRVADQLIGALACAAVWLRRRWPAGLAAVLAPLTLVSDTAGGAIAVSLFTVAVHRPFRYVAWIGGASLAIVPLYSWLRPDPSLPYMAYVVFGALVTVAVIGWGLLVRSRRRLLLTLRDLARQAEAEATLQAEKAQRLAREAIAREMHDVVAHRLSLLSVHAGAIQFRPDAPREEIARAAGVIRDNAHGALEELREIIGVLRGADPDTTEEDGRPQPALRDVGALVAASRTAGARIELTEDVPDRDAVPAAAGRTAYRVVQEALTNVRKHAPDARTTVLLRTAEDALRVEIVNSASEQRGSAPPGSGLGLVGLAERVALAGGRLEHGPVEGGGFAVRARLPYAS